VRDRVVDDRRPKEGNDEDGEEASALGDTADGDDGSQGGEHGLVEAEEESGDLGRTDGGSVEDVHETEVLEVANVGVGTGEGEGVAPEEPASVRVSTSCDRNDVQTVRKAEGRGKRTGKTHHSIVTSAYTASERKSMLNAFFRRRRPESARDEMGKLGRE
jgi:hypothetical protein